jgi:hypothetical protein
LFRGTRYTCPQSRISYARVRTVLQHSEFVRFLSDETRIIRGEVLRSNETAPVLVVSNGKTSVNFSARIWRSKAR